MQGFIRKVIALWHKTPKVVRRFVIAAIVLWALYGIFVFLPYIRAHRTLGNAAKVAMTSQAQQTINILSQLQIEPNGQPDSALAFNSLQTALNQQLDGFKTIDQEKLSSSDKDSLKQAVKQLDAVIKNASRISDQYGKILLYFPEGDLYGQDVEKDAALERAGNAVNNLNKLTIQNSASSDALANVITCLENLQKNYQKNACLTQYNTLRQAAIKDVQSQFKTQEVTNLQELLAKLAS